MFGLIFSLAPPLLFFSIIFIRKDPYHWRRYIWMFVLLLMLLAYSFVPTPNADLSRYFAKLDTARLYSFKEAVFGIKNGLYDGLYVINALFWIIAKTGCKGLLPAISAGVVYGISFYVTCDCAERYGKIDTLKWILPIQFFLLPYYNIINNVRNVMAFAIIIFALYRECVQKKKNAITYILYPVACFVHSFAIVAILIRILAGVIRKFRIIGITAVVFGLNIIELLYSNISIFAGIPIVYNVIKKSHRYLSPEYGETEWAVRVTTETFYRAGFYANILFGLAIVIFLGAVIRKQNSARTLEKDESVLVNWEFWIGILVLSCIPFSAPYYWRYATLAAMCLGAVLIIIEPWSYKVWGMTRWLFWGGAISIAGLQFYELLLRAMRTNWLEMFMLNNPYVIIIQIIRNLII